MTSADIPTRKIEGFGLTSPDATSLVQFYEAAFGARRLCTEPLTPARVEAAMSVRGGAVRHLVQLGEQTLDILQFDTPGAPYPQPASPYNTVFQHFALVVSDMPRALSQLRRTPGWTAISTGGPQSLPQRSGGVVAFKFQDPDGHPLELLQFARDAVPDYWREPSERATFPGIDHTAISVRNTAVSIAFYESLGFTVTAQTLNHGQEQAHLDGVPDPQVEVTALAAHGSTPHLELLCYRSGARPLSPVLPSNAVAATRIRLSVHGQGDERLLIDPDGHHLLLMP